MNDTISFPYLTTSEGINLDDCDYNNLQLDDNIDDHNSDTAEDEWYENINDDSENCNVYEKPKEYRSFNIVKTAIKAYEETSGSNQDDDVKLSDGCPYGMNKVVEKFQYFISSENLYDKTVANLFGLLSDILPNCKWPIQKVENNITVKLEDYSIEDFRNLHFDICPNYCMTYVGDFSELFKCPKCEINRYTKCKRCNKTDDCKHRFLRNPIRRVWYRPLILLVHDLLETENFLKAINYECESDTKYYRSDIRTGSNYKKHYAEMCTKFDDKNDNSLTMVNLLISEFYDGIQLFKTKVQNFWPLMISILNLPISMRIQSGIGTILISLYTGKLNTPTERFVLEECLVEELKQFYEGIVIEKNGKRFFVQIRLISTILDTKGFEETMHVQGTGSYAGCFLCNIGRGFKLGEKSKHVPILGHRVGLEIEHVLRYIGQSEECCPVNYYNTNVIMNSNKSISKNIDSESDVDSSNSEDDSDSIDNTICRNVGVLNFKALKTIDDYKAKLLCLNFTNNQFDKFKDYMQGKPIMKEWVWYHGYSNRRFHYDTFLNYLWFPHCDYRNQSQYRRRTTVEYYNDCKKLIELQKNKKSIKHVNGVKDVWHLHRLNYANIETDICWDPFHTLFNVSKNILKNWKDERSDQYNIPYLKKQITLLFI